MNTLHVFIASPGGVEEERDAVRSVVDELDRALRRHEWRIEALGWEDRGPVAGRAQADINEDVRRCDIFIGLLHDRWGAPTGEFDSGFEEEWTLAADRYGTSGSPNLWLYFKEPADDIPSVGAAGTQLSSVLAFRRRIEEEHLAFYKPFADLDEFVRLLRPRLLDEILRRSGLTRTDLGTLAVDWSVAYTRDPIDLLEDGRSRVELIDEVEKSKPAQAAAIATQLAEDAERAGFGPTAEELRARACRIWLAAGDSPKAVELLRSLLRAHAWELRSDDLRQLLHGLREDLPPEISKELRAWEACIDAPAGPEHSAETLRDALEQDHAFPLDEQTSQVWRAVRWRALLLAGRPREVVAEERPSPSMMHSDVALELTMLYADAFRAAGEDVPADAAWQDIRLFGTEGANESPEAAAWIYSRAALDALAREDVEAAEGLYLDAASRWSRVRGAAASAAQSFFSAQLANSLRGEWSFTGWSWRPIVALQLRGPTGVLARADELERRALLTDRGKDQERAVLLQSAMWCYARAGFAAGTFRCRDLLADTLAADGEHAAAVSLYCANHQSKQAEDLAKRTDSDRAVADCVAGAFPNWADGARFAVLGVVGRAASRHEAEALADEALAAVGRQQSRFDNTSISAANALAALGPAVDEPSTVERIVAELGRLSRHDRYPEAKAGRFGLRLLHDIGRIDAADQLVAAFVADPRIDEPEPGWVASHLDDAPRLEMVRTAALSGAHHRALSALLAADAARSDDHLREHCAALTRRFVSSNIGMTEDGSGVHGLLALEFNGHVAARSDDSQLRAAAAERLLNYASDSRWPMVNRVRALAGLYWIAIDSDNEEWLSALRPLCAPDEDLDEQAPRFVREMFAARGDLEATALEVASLIGAADPPEWLAERVGDAFFDEREPMRRAAWRAAAQRAQWFDRASARHAFRDDYSGTRMGALYAWRCHGGPLPDSEVPHLAADSSIGVRLELIEVLRVSPSHEGSVRLRADEDAYVRGIARLHLSV